MADWFPATLSSTDVQNAINSASDGDRIFLPSLNNGVWDSGSITINKALIFQGGGIGVTVIDISGTVFGTPTISVTKQTTGKIWFKDLTFTDLAGTHDADPTHCIKADGGWGTAYWPIIFKRVRFELTGWNW